MKTSSKDRLNLAKALQPSMAEKALDFDTILLESNRRI